MKNRTARVGNDLFKNTAVSAIATGIQGLANLVAVVYLARIFGPSAYGVFSYTWAVIGIVGVFTYLGVPTLLNRKVSLAEDSALPHLVGLGLSITSLISISIGVLYLVAVQVIPGLSTYRLLFDIWTLALLPAGVTPRWIFSGLSRLWMSSVVDLAATMLRLVCILCFVHSPKQIPWAIAITVGTQFVAMLADLAWIRRIMPWRFQWISWHVGKDTIRQGLPLAITGFVGILYSGVDTWLLEGFRGATEVGYYAAAYRPVAFLATFSLVYFNLAFPILSRLIASAPKDVAQFLQRATLAIVAIVLPIGLGSDVIARPLMIAAFGPRYAASGPVLMIIIWSWAIGLLRDTFSTALIASHREKQYAKFVGLGGALNLVAMLFLVRFDGVGLASALVLTQLVLFAFCLRSVQRSLRPPVAWRPISRSLAKLLISSVGMALAVMAIQHWVSVWIAIGAGIVIYGGLVLITQALPITDLLATFRPTTPSTQAPLD